MSRQEHLRVIQQGAGAWNRWREVNELVVPHLICANLGGADLVGVDLVRAELPRASFHRANLVGANLSGATAVGADFREAELSGGTLIGTILTEAKLAEANLSLANLSAANLSHASLRGANLMNANLIGANLLGADLTDANLSGADLSGANLMRAQLDGVNLSLALLSGTILSTVRLTGVKGLESCQHLAPSVLDHWTLAWSGALPQGFLRGCGVPDELIAYWQARELRGAAPDSRAHLAATVPRPVSRPSMQAYAYYLGHSGADQPFASRLQDSLQSEGFRCWLTPQDRPAGNRFRGASADPHAPWDRVLLVLSQSCIRSSWAEKLVQAAMERERTLQTPLLFAVCLDDSCWEVSKGWCAELRQMRGIVDFRGWTSAGEYLKAVARLTGQLRQANE